MSLRYAGMSHKLRKNTSGRDDILEIVLQRIHYRRVAGERLEGTRQKDIN